jgi:6-phosphogluconolactonase
MGHSSDTGELGEIEVYPDAERLAQAAAAHFAALAGEAIADHGRFAVALAGGSTPKAAYKLLAEDEFVSHVDWARVHVFWGDERPVAPDHPDSNYRMAREALLDHVLLPAENVHRMRGELEPAQAAADYEQELRLFFASPSKDQGTEPRARFDLVLLGMGDDGHTASLFPGTAAIEEQTAWVIAHFVEKLDTWRITLTPAVINTAADVTFIVSGSGKAERLRQVLTGPYQPEEWPAQIVDPNRGRLRWLVDEAAATRVERGNTPDV